MVWADPPMVESGEFFISCQKEVPPGYVGYITIICNHFQKFQKFKDSELFYGHFRSLLNILKNTAFRLELRILAGP